MLELEISFKIYPEKRAEFLMAFELMKSAERLEKNEPAWNFSNWSESQTHSYGLNNGAMLSPWLITVMKINSGPQWVPSTSWESSFIGEHLQSRRKRQMNNLFRTFFLCAIFPGCGYYWQCPGERRRPGSKDPEPGGCHVQPTV